jgi:hypothetical protein
MNVKPSDNSTIHKKPFSPEMDTMNELSLLVEYQYELTNRMMLSKKSHKRKRALAPMYLYSCGLLDDIFLLLKNERVNSAAARTRTLLEMWVQISFLIVEKNEFWINALEMSGELGKKKLLKNIRELKKVSPTHTVNKTYTNEKLSEYDKLLKESMKSVNKPYVNHPNIERLPKDRNKKFKLKKPFTVRDMCIIADYFNNDKASADSKNNFEWTYCVVYWLLSGEVHASPLALASNIIGRDDKGLHVFKYGDITELNRIAWTAYSLQVNIIEIISERFGVKNARKLKDLQRTAERLSDYL